MTSEQAGMVTTPGAATTARNESQQEKIQIWERPPQSYHAHFDCFSGAAGDMMLAACLDASDQVERLTRHVTTCISLGLPELAGEFEIETNRVWRGGMGSIAGLHVTVHSRYNHAPAPVPKHHLDLEGSLKKNDSHDHDHSHSHEHSHDHEHSHKEHRETDINTVESAFDKSNTPSSWSEHDHSHKHVGANVNDHSHSNSSSHSHGHSHQSDALKGPLRNLPEIQKMLEEAPEEYIAPWVHKMASSVFTELALAEAQTHGAESIDAVHFHEVGAVDSIVDTVGTLIALYSLGVTSVSCSRLPMGEGTVWTEHGLLPVPAPATLRLMVDMPICQGPPGVTGELVTPTGAALLRALTKGSRQKGGIEGRPPNFTIRKIGIGAGTKDYTKHPNVLRLLLGDSILTREITTL